jgi:hypothetical protein
VLLRGERVNVFHQWAAAELICRQTCGRWHSLRWETCRRRWNVPQTLAYVATSPCLRAYLCTFRSLLVTACFTKVRGSNLLHLNVNLQHYPLSALFCQFNLCNTACSWPDCKICVHNNSPQWPFPIVWPQGLYYLRVEMRIANLSCNINCSLNWGFL